MLTRRALVCSATLALAGRSVAQERTRLVFATAGQGSAFLMFAKAVAPVAERYVLSTLRISCAVQGHMQDRAAEPHWH